MSLICEEGSIVYNRKLSGTYAKFQGMSVNSNDGKGPSK